MLKFNEWEEFYKSKKFQHIKTIKNTMPSGMIKLIKTEGFRNFVKILSKMITSSKNRKKMMAVQNVFSKYKNLFGYGIYCNKK
jgi:hypothetical protein